MLEGTEESRHVRVWRSMQAAGVCHPGLPEKKQLRRVEMHQVHRPALCVLPAVLRTGGPGGPFAMLSHPKVARVQDAAERGGETRRQTAEMMPGRSVRPS